MWNILAFGKTEGNYSVDYTNLSSVSPDLLHSSHHRSDTELEAGLWTVHSRGEDPSHRTGLHLLLFGVCESVCGPTLFIVKLFCIGVEHYRSAVFVLR